MSKAGLSHRPRTGDRHSALRATNGASTTRDGSAESAAEAFPDERPVAIAQRKLVDAIGRSPRVAELEIVDQQIQRSPFVAAQRKHAGSIAPRNDTGLPDRLKSGIESLSGMAMDNVRVHYNSSLPARLDALAYARGTEIHVGPGQERHLPHEAWHVVQQAQGRVQPTMRAGDGVPVNDDKGLEREADLMGAKASSSTASPDRGPGEEGTQAGTPVLEASSDGPAQRHISWDAINNQFVIDNTRPGWMGAVGAMAVGWGQSKNHIVPFAGIQNDLCVLLNQLVAAAGAPAIAAAQAEVVALCESLFPNPSPDRVVMRARRLACINAIAAGTVGLYHNTSRALLSALNSSPDNVRAGGAINNLRIGENLDADFVAGSIWYAGPAISNGVLIPAVNQNVLTLTAASNRVVYNYFHQQEQSPAIQGGFGLTFVLSLLTGRQISSGTGPTAGGGMLGGAALPVLVTDPAGAANPYLFQ